MQAKDKQRVVAGAIKSNSHLQGALLPILHQIQNKIGHIPSEHVADISVALNLSRAEVHGVISFYHSFTATALGRHTIEICRAESCQAVGSRDIEQAVKNKLAIDYDQTSKDGEFTLQAVYCLGNCACSPSIKIDTEIFGRVSPDSVISLIDDLKLSASK